MPKFNEKGRVECNRCRMTFAIVDGMKTGQKTERTACVSKSCTRRFHHMKMPTGGKAMAYMTPNDVSDTVSIAAERVRAGMPVNNGGCQQAEFTEEGRKANV